MRGVPNLRRRVKAPRVEPSTRPSDPRLPASGLWRHPSHEQSTLSRLAASVFSQTPRSPPGHPGAQEATLGIDWEGSEDPEDVLDRLWEGQQAGRTCTTRRPPSAPSM